MDERLQTHAPSPLFSARGRVARYVHARRLGWRLLRPFLPNVIGPFYRSSDGTQTAPQPPKKVSP